MSNIVQIDGKFYDFGTKNTSFLLTAQELKTLGIKRWYVMLEVKYPQLGVQDIDPYDPNISAEDTAKIHLENRDNPWFYFRECVRIPVRGASNPYRFTLTRASSASIWCYIHSIDFMLNQPRQTFKTTTGLSILTHSFIYTLSNASIPMMHLYEAKVMENAGMFRDYINTLPDYMNPFINKKKIGIKSMKYDEHNAKVRLITSAKSESEAGDKLRGDTIFVGLIDEWEYIDYIDSVIMGGMNAVLSGRSIAKENGSRSCLMYTSTPGNLETPEGKAAQRMIDATPVWSESYYDMTDKEIEEMFNGVEREDGTGEVEKIRRLYIEYDYKQLRKDEKWLHTQYNEAVGTGKIDEYRRGVLLQRYRGAEVVLFNQNDIDYMVNNQRKPDHDVFINKKFHLYCYDHKMYATDLNSDTPYFDITIPYLIGIDVSTGTDNDNTTMCIVHPYTLEIVAELISPYIGTTELTDIIVTVAKLVPKGVFCLEANSIGKAIVAFVQDSQLEYRFYHDPKLDISKNSVAVTESVEMKLKRRAIERRYIGTTVSPTIRQNMFQLLKRYVKDFKHLINSKYVVKDIQDLTIKKGKIQADSGAHDDMVMAYLHCIYVLQYGYDLTRFGINKELCTFETSYDIIKEYDKSLEEEKVDNMKPYEQPTVYEEQLLNDIVNGNNNIYVDETGHDAYGYNPSVYNQRRNDNINPLSSDLTRDDFAFCSMLNTF